MSGDQVQTGRARPGRPKTRETVPVTRTLDRGLSVLELLAENPDLGSSDIARRLKMSPSTISRLLTTLSERGFVGQDEGGLGFHIGVRAFEVGNAFTRQQRLDQIAAPVLRPFAESIGETVNVAIPAGGDIVHVAQFKSSGIARAVMPVGWRRPLHSTAAGKVILAWLWEERVRELVGPPPLAAFTRYTITNVSALLGVLEQVRRQGYALDNQEAEEGVCCVAAPIRSATQKVIAAVSVSTIESHATPERVARLAPSLQRIGEDISRRLGWRAPQQFVGRPVDVEGVFND